MHRHALVFAIALVVAASGVASVAIAQTAAPAKPERMNPDANGDGAIDRGEAAAMPRLAEHFDRLDRNGDGRLDRSELPRRQGQHRRGGHGGPGGHGGVIQLDSDRDGRISRAEVEAGPPAARKLLQHFAAIDGNRDGQLDRGELRAFHERMHSQRQAEHGKRLDAKFAEADLNRDGKLSRVEVGEKMPRLAERFAWMDENRDGFLSREELRGKPRQR